MSRNTTLHVRCNTCRTPFAEPLRAHSGGRECEECLDRPDTGTEVCSCGAPAFPCVHDEWLTANAAPQPTGADQ